MPAHMQGDYSKYPQSVREIYPYLYGEVCELHTHWQVYQQLFMDKKERTDIMAKYLGGVFSYYQAFLQDDMMLGIVRLTDPDSKAQQNLGFAALCRVCKEWDAQLGAELMSELQTLLKLVVPMRQHRHKRLAHYDLNTSLGAAILPSVTFTQMREAIEQMEKIVSTVAWRGEKTTILFDTLDHRDISDRAEIAVAKAAAYDALEAEQKIERRYWRKFITA